LVHAAANSTAAACYGASWWQRRRGRHVRGVLLGLAGATAATIGGYLGGHLVATMGVGVDHTAFDQGAEEWTAVANSALVGREPVRVRAQETAVMLLRAGPLDTLVCLGAVCPHRGAPMEEGTVREGAITCPWHGSRFATRDGALLNGPATRPLPRFECRVHEELVEVRGRVGDDEATESTAR
jgi:nitrite reductase/ring-hydroxylating ferredoxin subunit